MKLLRMKAILRLGEIKLGLAYITPEHYEAVQVDFKGYVKIEAYRDLGEGEE
jgi:hypothetical protein